MLRVIETHLGSRHVSRVTYGAIIGLALIVSLQAHPPAPGVVVASLLGTAVAVALAELYSDILGTETRKRRRVQRGEVRSLAADCAAVAFGVSFPAVFFALSAAGAMKIDTAFDIAKWSGLALIGLYGYAASRLAGERVLSAALYAAAIALVGAFLIALKSLVH